MPFQHGADLRRIVQHGVDLRPGRGVVGEPPGRFDLLCSLRGVAPRTQHRDHSLDGSSNGGRDLGGRVVDLRKPRGWVPRGLLHLGGKLFASVEHSGHLEIDFGMALDCDRRRWWGRI